MGIPFMDPEPRLGDWLSRRKDPEQDQDAADAWIYDDRRRR
jgi:hypothetical protein